MNKKMLSLDDEINHVSETKYRAWAKTEWRKAKYEAKTKIQFWSFLAWFNLWTANRWQQQKNRLYILFYVFLVTYDSPTVDLFDFEQLARFVRAVSTEDAQNNEHKRKQK